MSMSLLKCYGDEDVKQTTSEQKIYDVSKFLLEKINSEEKKKTDELASKHAKCLLSLGQAIQEAKGNVNPNMLDMSLNDFLQMISRNEIEFIYKGKKS